MHVPAVWIFDIDGVLTDHETKKVSLPGIFGELVKRLRKGEPLAFNTGRSLEFVTAEIFDPLSPQIGDKALLRNCIAIGEKGAAGIVFDDRGEPRAFVDEQIQVPAVVAEEIRSLVSRSPYRETMFYDKSKRTMVSVEMKKGVPLGEYRRQQQPLVAELRSLLRKHGLEKHFKVDPTAICTDVESTDAGKALGIRQILKHLEEKNITAGRYVCFGDSPSDIEMLGELQRLGKPAELVYVGPEADIPGNDTLIHTHEKGDRGTLAYLQNH